MKQQEHVSVQFKCRAYLPGSEQKPFFFFQLRRTKYEVLLPALPSSLCLPVEGGLFNGIREHIEEIKNKGIFIEPKYYYRPIPETLVLLNPNLEQIYGWD